MTVEQQARIRRRIADIRTEEIAILSARDIPELQQYLEDIQTDCASHHEALSSLTEQLDARKVDLTGCARAQKHLLGRLYNNAQPFLDASQQSGTLGHFRPSQSFEMRLRHLVILHEVILKSQATTKILQQDFLDASSTFRNRDCDMSGDEYEALSASLRLAKDSSLEAQRHLNLRKAEQRSQETNFLLEVVLPMLVEQDLLQSPHSPAASSNYDDLIIFKDEERERRPCDTIKLSAGEGRDIASSNDLLKKVVKKRRIIFKRQRKVDSRKKDRQNKMARFLVLYPTCSLEAYNEAFSVESASYEEKRLSNERWLDVLRKEYTDLKEKAIKENVDHLPLSPMSFAEKSEDDDNDSIRDANTKSRTRGGPRIEKRVRRWQRRVARQPSEEPREVEVASLRSITDWSDEYETTVMQSNKRWVQREEMYKEAIRDALKRSEPQTPLDT